MWGSKSKIKELEQKIECLEKEVSQLFTRITQMQCSHPTFEITSKYNDSGCRFDYYRRCIYCGIYEMVTEKEFNDYMIRKKL